jgi:hypothetical protein
MVRCYWGNTLRSPDRADPHLQCSARAMGANRACSAWMVGIRASTQSQLHLEIVGILHANSRLNLKFYTELTYMSPPSQ